MSLPTVALLDMERKICGIYKITSPTGRVYIGQSVDIIRRKSKYKCGHCDEQPRLSASFKKYGFKSHLFNIIEECEVDKLNVRERYWQEHYDVLSKNGLNCRLTKTNDKSGKVGKETLIKMSIANLGSKREVGGFEGKKHSEESKLKISKSLKGRKMTDEWKRKRMGKNNHMYGKQLTETAKNKLRIKAINRYKNGNHPRHKRVINTQTGEVFDSAKNVSIITGIKYKTLVCWLNGHRKNKSHFIYEQENTNKQ